MDSVRPNYANYFLPHVELQCLIDALVQKGYLVIGPKVKEGAIVFDELSSVCQLPQGYRDEQSPGSYHLEQTASAHFFAWANGPQALKPMTFAPREMLWQVERNTEGKLVFNEVSPKPVKRAVIGARPCDIAALKVQERVFMHDTYADPYYAERRKSLFVIAVNCHYPATTCFCASTGDGPKATDGFDIVLTELASGFIVQAGSEVGEALLNTLSLTEPSDGQFSEAGNLSLEAEQKQYRKINKAEVKNHLFEKLNHEQWDDIAERCLSCGNCTMVCPTCFCHSENSISNLEGSEVSQVRQWDSCFTQGHSYIHGVTIRQQTKQRYRQWLTHKFSTWYEQFGVDGCVGCGRCIAWCPVGIDVTQELAVLCRQDEQ